MKTESLIPHGQVFYAPLMSMLEESVTSAIFGNLEDVSRLNYSLWKSANIAVPQILLFNTVSIG